jgi:MtN3 and saliva related transmembrane protein
MLFSVMQLIGGVILSLGWIPQIIQILKTKSVSDY